MWHTRVASGILRGTLTERGLRNGLGRIASLAGGSTSRRQDIITLLGLGIEAKDSICWARRTQARRSKHTRVARRAQRRPLAEGDLRNDLGLVASNAGRNTSSEQKII